MRNSHEVSISKELPPNYREMFQAFPLCKKEKAVFAYGNVIYNPFRESLDAHTVVHECVHFEQQARERTVDDWYTKYLHDKAFRLRQEVEAYRRQYAFVCKHMKDREKRSWFLGMLSQALSGELYGALCTQQEARALIKN